jgi:glyoxylase I family protein
MPRPLQITGIDHVLLIVHGMARSLAFYEGVLGCAIKTRLPQYGVVELAAGAHGLDLVDVSCAEGSWAKPAEDGGGNLHHLCLAIEAASEADLRAHLSHHAVTIVEERLEGGLMSLYVLDPSSNQVELRFRAG